MEKPLETALVGLNFGWVRASVNHESGENSMSQVDRVSEMVTARWVCGSVALCREGSEKEQRSLPALLSGR